MAKKLVPDWLNSSLSSSSPDPASPPPKNPPLRRRFHNLRHGDADANGASESQISVSESQWCRRFHNLRPGASGFTTFANGAAGFTTFAQEPPSPKSQSPKSDSRGDADANGASTSSPLPADDISRQDQLLVEAHYVCTL